MILECQEGQTLGVVVGRGLPRPLTRTVALVPLLTAPGQRSCAHLELFCLINMKESESASRSVVSNSATPWTAAHQAPLSMGFSRQEYQSGEPGPTPGDLPHPEIEPRSPALQADSLLSEPSGTPSPRTVRDPYPTPHLYPSLSIWLALPQIPSQVLYPR